jgi:hypothetical protein
VKAAKRKSNPNRFCFMSHLAGNEFTRNLKVTLQRVPVARTLRRDPQLLLWENSQPPIEY